jgi:hypothetical protein
MAVRGHGVVRKVSAHYRLQPRALFGDGAVPTTLEFLSDPLELRPHPLRRGPPHQQESPTAASSRTDVREAEEVERLRRPSEALIPSILGGEPAKLDQAGLLGVQLQGELEQALAEFYEELLLPGALVDGVTHRLADGHQRRGATTPVA